MFDLSRPLARTTDPDTSHDAARRIEPVVGGLERRVLEALRGMARPCSGLTVPEIAAATGIDKWSVSPRMKPLEDKGFVARLAKKRNGMTIWVAC
jgi:DNA-binding MarR family transcriptional regulator